MTTDEKRAYHREYMRTWSAAHRDRTREYVHARRARQVGVATCGHPACLTVGPVRLALQVNAHRCYLCAVSLSDSIEANMQVDHVVPLSRGGAHCGENIKPICASCNARKGRKLLSEMGPTFVHRTA